MYGDPRFPPSFGYSKCTVTDGSPGKPRYLTVMIVFGCVGAGDITAQTQEISRLERDPVLLERLGNPQGSIDGMLHEHVPFDSPTLCRSCPPS